MLDRTKQPPIFPIQNLHLPIPKKHILQNGIPLYEVNIGGTQEITKIEIIFRAGRPKEQKPMVARTTARMLREGTQQFDAAEIAEQLDYYGSTLSSTTNLDTANIVLYSLNKHLEQLLPIVSSIVTKPTFPQSELDTVINNSIQQIKVNETKCDVVAYRTITECIFTPDHPYGYNSSEEGYEALTRQDLINHFQSEYHAGNCTIIISGRTNPTIIQLLDQYFGTTIPRGIYVQPTFPKIATTPQKIKKIIPDSSQTAIRIGLRLFNKQHPDFQGLFVLNTILGGYFGSRLMVNIREEKGYTYNIFSGIDSMVYDGYFTIGTEVGNEYVADTLKEIYKEIDRLRTELVGEEELQMVRNYLLGNMLTMLDGAMNVADIIKSIVTEFLDYSDFTSLEKTINTISAEQLRDLAKQYLVKERMFEVVVGV